MENEIGKVRNCLQFFKPISSIMKKLSRLFISILFISVFGFSALGQSNWHTDPYPLNENIDVLHYIFDLKLEDKTDEITYFEGELVNNPEPCADW